MKEIKAYIRTQKAEEVIEALAEAGFRDVTLIDVMGCGHLMDPHNCKYSVEFVERYSELAKLELVCQDNDVDRVVSVIRDAAYTGMAGDGKIFATPVEYAMKIRTGERGTEALT